MSSSSRSAAALLRGATYVAGAAFGVAAAAAVVLSPELRAGGFVFELVLLGVAAALTRRFGIALPGRGFASFILAVILVALLLRGWYLAVLVGLVGVPLGDLVFKRRAREGVTVALHVALATGAAGLLYQSAGGALRAQALSSENFFPLLLLLVALPLIANGTFYLEIALTAGASWVDSRLTLRWEAVVTLCSVAFAVAWVATLTASVPPFQRLILSTILAGSGILAYWIVRRAVHADELRLVQGLAGAVAAEVNIERSFVRIQELTRHLVPWENMGFARYDASREELELLADTATAERLRIDARSGLTGEAIRRGKPAVANAFTQAPVVLPEGERAGSEVMVPLYHGDQLVGMWSVRHSDPTLYREADGELLNLLAPQLALSIVLSALLAPLSDSSEQTASYARQLMNTNDSMRGAADAVARAAAAAQSEAQSAVKQVAQAVDALARLSAAIDETMGAASQTQEAYRSVARAAGDVQDASTQTGEQLGALSSTIATGSAEVGRLRDAAHEVERFAETIAGIAYQTNLLALNATIEAARTGVHGHGFAVVADEVRKLAEQSAAAARKMGKNAQETRRVIDRAAGVLEELGRQLGELVTASARWGQELSAIVTRADAARDTGERMAAVPQRNLELAAEAQRILGEAQAAASRSASEAQGVAGRAADQLRAIEELSRGADQLRRLADELVRSGHVLRGNDSVR